ncbi:hypothetical protein [Parafrankia discariae]|uniref:hypothetical protein n=1 Tax=Parafrankia discariae TaxID=365528 RepID=UPI0003A4D226|nr:hypothetical protein [Parafrankia discariae]
MSRMFALSATGRPQTLAALASALGLLVAVIALLTPRGSHAATTAVGIVGAVAMLALLVGMGVLIGQAIGQQGGGGS